MITLSKLNAVETWSKQPSAKTFRENQCINAFICSFVLDLVLDLNVCIYMLKCLCNVYILCAVLVFDSMWMFDSEICNTRKIYGYFMEFSGKFYSFNKLKLNENQQTPPYDLTHTIISKRAMCNMCVRVCVYLRSRICKFWIIHLVFLVGEFWNCITDFSFALFVPCPFFLFALPLCQFIHHPTRFVAKVIFIMNLIRKQQSCGFWPYLANKSDSSLAKEFEKKTNSEKLHSQVKQLINSHSAAKWAFDSCWTLFNWSTKYGKITTKWTQFPEFHLHASVLILLMENQ